MHRYSRINEFRRTSKLFYKIAIGMDRSYTFVGPNYDRNFSLVKGTLAVSICGTTTPQDVRVYEEVRPKCFAEPGRPLPATIR